jgi:hypothetical protein
VVRWTLYHHGIAHVGPDVRSLLEPVDADALRRESARTLLDWGADTLHHPERFKSRFYQGLIVFTCCRVLQTAETGAVQSKRAGAEWAKEHLGEKWRDLIDRAWSTRPDPYQSSRTPADEEDYQATLQFVRVCMDRLREHRKRS